MGVPKSGLNPTTNSVGFTAKLVTVQSVSPDGKTAVCVDRLSTQTTVSMLVQRSKGPLPQPGESWLIAQDLGIWTFAAFVASTPADFATSGGSADITVSGQPPVAPSTGELWLNAAAGFELLEWTGLQWNPLQFGTSALADKSVTAAKIADGTITSEQIAPNAGIQASQVAFTAGDIGGTRVFKGTSQPSGMQPGDLWLNPANGNQIAEWDGNEWRSLLLGAPAIQPSSLTTAQLAAEAGITVGQVAFTYKDLGGMSATIAISAPPGPAHGDLWFDSTNGYALRRWDGTVWVPYQFGTDAIAAGSVTADLVAANAIIAGKIADGAITADSIEAGTVVAGIVNGTVIEGGTLIVSQGSGATFEQFEVNGATGVTTWSKYQGPTVVIRQILANGTDLTYADPGSGGSQGALIQSSSPVGGTDGFGNAYGDGYAVYSGNAKVQMHENTSVGFPAQELKTGVASEAENAAIYAVPVNRNLINELVEFNILGPGSSLDNAQVMVQLVSAAADGSSVATGVLYFVQGSSTPVAFWNSSGFYVIHGGNNYTPGHQLLIASGQTITSTTPQPITGLSTSIGTGNYRISGSLRVVGAASGTVQSFRFRLNGTCVLSGMRVRTRSYEETTSTSFNAGTVSALGADAGDTGGIANNAVFSVDFEGIIQVSTAGTLHCDGRQSTSSGSEQFTLQALSWMMIQPQ